MPLSRTFSIVAVTLSAIVSQPVFAGNLAEPTVTQVVGGTQQRAKPFWEGGYVGATLGYNFSGGDRIGILSTSGARTSVGNLDNSGWSGSLRAGYRWQFDRWVFGPEISIEGGKVEDSVSNSGYTSDTSLNRALALRWKAGMTVPVFNSIVYGSIGVVRGDFDYAVNGSGSAGNLNINEDFTTNGYSLGVGIEQPISERLSITGDYEYVNYGKETLTDSAGNSTVATPRFHNLRLGLNLRF